MNVASYYMEFHANLCEILNKKFVKIDQKFLQNIIYTLKAYI